MQKQVDISGAVTREPVTHVLFVERVAKAVAKEVGADPAECVMMLLTAAVKIARDHSTSSTDDLVYGLARSLGAATVTAERWFTPRLVPTADNDTAAPAQDSGTEEAAPAPETPA